jgi:uncharacterized RDD family membrane protein YckC
MRCPSCGYVIFDQVTKCPNCGESLAITEVNEEVKPREEKERLPPDDQIEFPEISSPEPVDTGEWKLSLEPEIEEKSPETAKEIDFESRDLLKPHRPVSTQVEVAKPRAGFWVRSLALIIDFLCLNLTSIFLVSLGILILGRNKDLLISAPLDLIQILLIPTYLFLLLINLLYFTLFHAATGQTLGKLLCGIKVVKLDGGELEYGQSFLRFSGYLLSALPLGLGFIWAAFDPKKLTWHDRVAETCVIRYSK